MTNTCEGSHYTCGEKAEWLIGGENKHLLTQTRDSKSSFMLGNTEIVVVSQKRDFSIQGEILWELEDGAFLMYDNDSLLFQCASRNNSSNGALSEDCTVVTTVTHFLDARHCNGVFTEVKDELKFSATGELCGFKQTWGVQYYHKFVVLNPTIKRTTTYFVVAKGVKKILKQKIDNVPAYSSPLILVFPNPPSLAIPWINCEDINTYGFYDYRAAS